jgi:nucleotide-binding universal stress UspA family protein
MRRILVPVDGSEPALRALAFAADRAEEAGGVVHVLTVHPPLRAHGAPEIYAGQERLQQLAMQHDEQVLATAMKHLRGRRLECTQESREGEPAEIIARRAEELGCDAIVMGTRGMGLVGSLVMGSIATKVVHLSAVPVTLVK